MYLYPGPEKKTDGLPDVNNPFAVKSSQLKEAYAEVTNYYVHRMEN